MYAIGTLLGIRGIFITHVGVYIGNDMVLHNHKRNDVEIVSLQEFSNGRGIVVLESGVDDAYGFLVRLHQETLYSRSYNLVTYNCEHMASLVRLGEAHSTQLASIAFAVLIGIFIQMLPRE